MGARGTQCPAQGAGDCAEEVSASDCATATAALTRAGSGHPCMGDTGAYCMDTPHSQGTPEDPEYLGNSSIPGPIALSGC